MSVSDVVQNFKNIERSSNCYIHPNIPPKKLKNCTEAFCFSGEQVDFLLDDTVWGSAKDGMAISNSSLYYKQMGEGAKCIDLSSVENFTCEKRSLGNLELFSDGMPFLTISGFDKAYHDILMDLLNASAAEARSMKQSKSEAAEVTTPDTPASKPLTSAEAEIVCAGCDARMPAGAKFCPECGTQVPAKGICGECNEELPKAAKFCPKCGASSGVQKAPVEPLANLNTLREQLAEWLAGAEQEASIDSDGDMSFRINQTKPDFAAGYRAWSTKYDITVSSEGKSEEQTDTACFNPDDDFSVGSPYCRIGRLAAAQYQGTINASFFVLKNVEVHAIELKEGQLQIPKLGSNKISISSLTARKDDDGSFGVEYELSAYPGHIVSFEFSSEKPEDDASAWGRFEEEPTQTGTSWLWDVKPGQKVYLTFGEFEPLVDGVQASFSGEARPSEGTYDSNEASESTWSDDVPSSGNEDVDTILQAAAERMLELDWFEDSITSGGSVQKLALFLTGEPDEFTITARMGVADRQDELDEDELQETRSAIETYFDLNDVKVQLSSQGYDWSGLAGIECEISLLEGENGGSRGFGGQGSDSGDGVTGYFEWHMFRGSVNIDDMEDEDERDAAEQAAVLVEQGDQEGALQALPALWFEYNMDNLDSSPDEFMPGSQQVYFEANYANPDHDIVLDYEDGTLIVTATIRFPMQVNPGVDEDEINDWLSENGGYAAGFLSANWSYNGDEGGHFVFREFAEDGVYEDNSSFGAADYRSEALQSVRDKLASSTALTVFIADEAGEDLRDELVQELIGDGARCITVDAGQSMMDYVAPLLEVEDGHTAILNGVQNISEDVIDDFLRIVCDRVLVGTIGEGDAARSFETAIPQFNLVLVEHGSEDLNFGTFRMRQASQLVVTDDQVLILDGSSDGASQDDDDGSAIPGEVEQYIRLNDDGTVSAVIVYTAIEDAGGDVVIRGAYYGYCGGGVNEGGYFVIDHENGDVRALEYSDIDELESDDPELAAIYNSLMQEVWKLLSEDDGELKLSAEGEDLMAEADDTECCMSSGFDGDALDEVSQLWHMTLHFES